MTIKEAVAAARECLPVIYEDPVFGPMIFKRIAVIAKIYPDRVDDADPERYELTLASFRSRLGGMTNIDPEDVRLATPEELEDVAREDEPGSIQDGERIAS